MNFNKIFSYANMALVVYESETEIRKHFPEEDVLVVQDLSGTDGQYFVVKDTVSDILTIAIRGTANLENVLVDAEYTKKKDPKLGVFMHRGFDKAAQELYASVLPLVKPYQEQGYSFRLTGHSMGGAMAAILMLLLAADGYQVEQTITFGQPKFTNHKGVKRYREMPLLRVIDDRDLVPLVPPLTVVAAEHGRYQHFGPEIVLLRDQYYVSLTEPESEPPAVSSFWRNLVNERVQDHHMSKYVERLQPKLENAQPVPYKDRLKYA